ncbi:hypothetical protein ACFC1T_18095 [Kitasatospora sp. NPDC056076]|uniref:hypothetical protein n=1 Tax=Kitasatospora sp. NPDC056076 TaxID=3345703 RepID=UPI0035D94268
MAELVEEAGQQDREKVWELSAGDLALACEVETGLRAAVGPPEIQAALPQIDRLERLRESLAVLAIAIARTHGRLVWFLSGVARALEPVLR